MVLMLSERKLRPVPKLEALLPPPKENPVFQISEDEDMDGDGVLSVEEAWRRFQLAVGQARESQLKWIEALGPPEGWVRLADVEKELAARSGGSMSDITRAELDARFDAIGTKIDARAASLEGKMDAFIAVQSERDRAFQQHLLASERQLDKVADDLKSIKADVKTTSDEVVKIRIKLAWYSGGFAIIAAIAGLVGGLILRLAN